MIVKIANSPRLLLLAALLVLGTSSTAYSITENVGWLDSLYWAIVTSSTVGYGDLLPKSGAAKVNSVCLIFTAVFFFVPMITASLASRLIVNRDAFTHEEQERLMHRLEQLLGNVDHLDGDKDL